MLDWNIVVVPTLLAATVEWVEAFTIVLAVSLAIGWRACPRGCRNGDGGPGRHDGRDRQGYLVSGWVYPGCNS